MLVLFALVFAVGFVALVSYVLALRSAGRAASDADAPATAEGSARGGLFAGLAAFVAFAIAGGVAYANTTPAKPSTASPTGTIFKLTKFSHPSMKVAHVVKLKSGPAYRINVNAQQFLWRYQYGSGAGAAWNTYSYNNLVLPAGVTVLLDFTSSDAEAAWWVPQLGGSVTAMPGYDNQVAMRVDKPGFYTGAGTVVNGTNYASMTTNVTVVNPALFEAWVTGKQDEIAKAMTALGLERSSGEESQLVTGEKGAGAATAASEAQQTEAANQEGK